MDDDRQHDRSNIRQKASDAWLASLELTFARQGDRSYLAHRQHHGPLVVQKSLHPEGESVCHAVIVHPPGGVAGGDQLQLNVQLGEGASTLLTMPGAGKWYKSAGREAQQDLRFQVAANASLEWLPQENILFDASQVRWSTDIELAKNACYAGWEITCFGRQAQQEVWNTGAMHQNVTIKRDGRPIWVERAHLNAQSPLMRSAIGLRGYAVNAGFVVVAGAVPPAILQACREMTENMAFDLHAKTAMTALPEVFVARYVGDSSQQARHYFEKLWQILRPWYLGREACRPRIWNT